MSKTSLITFTSLAVVAIYIQLCGCRAKPNPVPESAELRPDSEATVAAFEALGADMERNASGRITKLNLAYCDVDAQAMEQIQDLASLEWLILDGTRITDDMLAPLASNARLESLYLASTPITDRGLEQIAKLRGLKRLQLSQTQVTDSGLMHLNPLTELESLWLHGTSVSEEGVATLQEALPQVEIHY